MGNKMGKIEIDDRGRITLPSEIRKRLQLRPGEKPSKKSIFKDLVGCIKTPTDKKPPQSR